MAGWSVERISRSAELDAKRFVGIAAIAASNFYLGGIPGDGIGRDGAEGLLELICWAVTIEVCRIKSERLGRQRCLAASASAESVVVVSERRFGLQHQVGLKFVDRIEDGDRGGAALRLVERIAGRAGPLVADFFGGAVGIAVGDDEFQDRGVC